MKTATISEIKKELATLEQPQILEICLRIAKYKKENKELLSYLLFEAHNEAEFIVNVQKDITVAFTEINLSNLYYAKKGIRKTLRLTQKNIKYSGIKQTEIELLLFFCNTLKDTKIHIKSNATILNLYNRQINKIKKLLPSLHEDLQYDYQQELNEIDVFGD